MTTPVRISIRVKPRSSRTRILRTHGLSIEASLAAPPVDGAANAELLALLAEVLKLPKRSLRLVLGDTSKTKVVEITGLSGEEVVKRLTAGVR